MNCFFFSFSACGAKTKKGNIMDKKILLGGGDTNNYYAAMEVTVGF